VSTAGKNAGNNIQVTFDLPLSASRSFPRQQTDIESTWKRRLSWHWNNVDFAHRINV